MDARLMTLDHQVAEAAQAWLDDPGDTAVYARLVLAVQTRRLHLRQLARGDEVAGGAADGPLAQAEGDESPDVPVDPERLVVRVVGDELAGDPQSVLRRLRGLP